MVRCSWLVSVQGLFTSARSLVQGALTQAELKLILLSLPMKSESAQHT